MFSFLHTHQGPVVSLLRKVSRKNALQARRAFFLPAAILRKTLSSKETTGPLCVLTCSRYLSSNFSDKKIDFLYFHFFISSLCDFLSVSFQFLLFHVLCL